MNIGPLEHYTLRLHPSELSAVREFYVDVLGLAEGPRADFSFPGCWLYGGGAAIVHLAATMTEEAAAAAETGRLDHIALRASGLAATRERLRGRAVAWHEAPVPGMPLHQIFLRDPTGLRIELTFPASELSTV